MQDQYVVRFSSQIGVGLDPYKAVRKERPKVTCYLKGLYFQGGPQTANRYLSKDVASAAIDRVDGLKKEKDSIWLGHCWPCEIVSVQQAYAEEGLFVENRYLEKGGLHGDNPPTQTTKET